MTTIMEAIISNNINLVRSLHEQGEVLTVKHMLESTRNNHSLEFMTYLHENGCPWNWKVCQLAASYGRLDCLQYAHENGCEWDEATTEAAAKKGHLDCLRYAREGDEEDRCPWNEEAIMSAALNNQFACVKYIVDNMDDIDWSCDEEERDTQNNAAAFAAQWGNLEMLKCVVEKGCPIDTFTFSFIGFKCFPSIDCIQYLLEKTDNSNVVYCDSSIFETLLDDPFWRNLLFTQDLSSNPTLEQLVNDKKKEIERLKNTSIILYTRKNLPKDLLRYQLFSYF